MSEPPEQPFPEHASDGRGGDLRASDLRQYLYCPRVVYFSYVVPVKRVETFSMQQGRVAEIEHARLERRRTLGRYGLEHGVRRYSVSLRCRELGVTGIVDEVVDSADGPVPIDVKHTTGGAAFGHKVQLALYAMALEETCGRPVPRGFIHLVPGRGIVSIAINDQLRAATRDVVRRVREMLQNDSFPAPADRMAKCAACELRFFCNDVF
jgi:CRISPR-associated exonuclease Cas4